MKPRLLIILLLFCCNPAYAAGHQGLSGFTYTNDKIFISRAQGSDIANIHIYGWGSLWPFPEGQEREHDDGKIIEQRILQAAKDGQQIVLTCATAPSNYRQSGKPWQMEERVLENMEDQYAAHCAATVRRWPQITRVQVWNELKGYWDKNENRWDYEGYTRFYNKVYDAVKAARPDVLVGGGYAVITARHPHFSRDYNGVSLDTRAVDALQYWLQHAKGYDAICLDANFDDPADFVKAAAFFRDLAHNKPVWWSEYYGRDNIETMHKARQLIEQSQKPGDIALWWASNRFPW
jgi:hypothetical protein